MRQGSNMQGMLLCWGRGSGYLKELTRPVCKSRITREARGRDDGKCW